MIFSFLSNNFAYILLLRKAFKIKPSQSRFYTRGVAMHHVEHMPVEPHVVHIYFGRSGLELRF